MKTIVFASVNSRISDRKIMRAEHFLPHEFDEPHLTKGEKRERFGGPPPDKKDKKGGELKLSAHGKP
jgi:hypothetical protein